MSDARIFPHSVVNVLSMVFTLISDHFPLHH